MSDEGIRKMFDQCSDDFFIAVEDELGEIRKGRFLIHPSFTWFFIRVISLLKVGQKFVLARKNLFNSDFTSKFSWRAKNFKITASTFLIKPSFGCAGI